MRTAKVELAAKPMHTLAVQGGFVSGDSVCEVLDAFLDHVLEEDYAPAIDSPAALKLALDQHEPFEIVEVVPGQTRNVGYPVDAVDPIERVGWLIYSADEAFALLLPYYHLGESP